MSLNSILQIGLSGILADTNALQTASNNVANESTPGYVNETPVFSANASQVSSFGSLGNGVHTQSIQRSFSSYAQSQVLNANAVASGFSTQQTVLNSLSSIFPVSSGQTGLAQSMSEFFASVQTLTTNPSSIPYRQSVLSQGGNLATQIQNAANTVSSTQASDNQQITQSVQTINNISRQLAGINKSLQQTPAGEQPPSSLLDSQNALVQQLSAQVGVQTLQNSNGTLSVFTKGGLTLVNGTEAFGFTVMSGGVYQNQMANVVYSLNPQNQGIVPSGGIVLSGTAARADLAGGILGGAISAQNQVNQIGLQLGLLAQGVAQVMNHQQTLGLNLGGGAGAPIFSINGPVVYPENSNSGNATITATITNLSTVPPTTWTLSYNGTNWVATNNTSGAQSSVSGGGGTLPAGFTFSGITVSGSTGSAAIGDSFLIDPAAASAGSLQVVMTDPSGLAAAAPYVASPGQYTSANGLSGGIQGTESISSGAALTGVGTSGTGAISSAYFGDVLSLKFATSGSSATYNITTTGGLSVGSGVFSNNGLAIGIAYSGSSYGASATSTGAYFGFQWGGTGAPATNDIFSFTAGAPGNNANALAMTDGQNMSTLYVGGGTAQYSYNGGASTNSGTVTLQNPTIQSTSGGASAVVASGYFGDSLAVQFTSSSAFQITSGSGSSSGVIATGAYSTSGANLAIAFPSNGPNAGSFETFSWGGGAPVSGDSFSLGVVTSGAQGASLNQGIANMTNSYGDTLQVAQQGLQAAQTVQSQATNAMSSISGVNLNQEASMIVQYTQAFQASAAVIQTVNTLFQSLLQVV
ncbi:flagellar hook-associated protein FlgK [Acidithiobacillus ferrivorans]|nr:flagellar hook-associated protein FlgK [Acidithiobacillus ferrivorans]